MKSKLSIGVTSIVAALSLSAYNSNVAHSQSVELPYVYSNVQFPGVTHVGHTFRLRVPANSLPLTSVKITAPEGTTVKNDVSIDDKSGNKIAATTVIDGQNIIINFARPVAAGTDLNIDLNRVKLWGLSRNYQVAVLSASSPTQANQTSPQVASASLKQLYSSTSDNKMSQQYQSIGSVQFRSR